MGGAFRDLPCEKLADVTVEQALRHPQWEMGAKITIDSSTLVNKGFEVIEAHWLFGTPVEKITVLLRPGDLAKPYGRGGRRGGESEHANRRIGG